MPQTMRKLRHVYDHKQINFLLKEAEMYLQFLNEDVDSVESINENIASQIAQMLSEVKIRLRESANLLDFEIKGDKKSKEKANIL